MPSVGFLTKLARAGPIGNGGELIEVGCLVFKVFLWPKVVLRYCWPNLKGVYLFK